MKRSGLVIALAIAVLIGAITWAILNTHGDASTALTRSQVAHHIAHRVQISQVEACHEVGDPLRRGEIALWQEKLDSTRNIRPSDFPGFSVKRFHRLVDHQRSAAQHHIQKLRGAPSCEERFLGERP